MDIWGRKDDSMWDVKTDGQTDKWQHAKSKFRVMMGNSCPFRLCQGCSHRWTSKWWRGVLTYRWLCIIGEGWGRLQNAGSNPCPWEQEVVVLWRSWELMLRINKGWAPCHPQGEEFGLVQMFRLPRETFWSLMKCCYLGISANTFLRWRAVEEM